MRNLLIVLWLTLCSITSSVAQVSVGIGMPGVSIGINLPVYPQLVPVPGYPVYYAPQINSNYFFYDGMYWVYQRDNWYASSWYNGPWGLVSSEAVPLFVLRVPVRYYRRPPTYFYGWRSDAPPRWGEHWGSAWEQRRSGWDNWNRSAVPAPAPLPVYQRQYAGNRYPRMEQQQALQSQNYRYQPQDVVVQQHYQAQRTQSAPANAPPVSRARPPQTGGGEVQRPVGQAPTQPPGGTAQRQAPPPHAATPRQPQQPTQPTARQAQPPSQAATQRQAQQPQQALTSRQVQPPQHEQRSQQAPTPRQAQPPLQAAPQRQGGPLPQVTTQRQAQQPQQAAGQHDRQPTPKKGQEKGEQQGAERNK